MNICKQQVNDYIVIEQILSKVDFLTLSGLPIKGPVCGFLSRHCAMVLCHGKYLLLTRLSLAVRRSSLCVQVLYNLGLLFTIKTVELKIC